MSNQATVFYPNNTLQIPVNIKDSIDVTYRTPWTLTNLTLLCRAPTSSIFDFYNVPDNPLAPDGHYLTMSIESMNLNVHTFPADCKFRLTQYGNIAVNADSAFFSLSSVEAPPKTFAISSTIGLSTIATSASQSSISTTTASTTASTTALSTTTTTAATNSQAALSQPILSKSASIGIAVGVIIGVLIILISALIILRARHQRNNHNRRRKHNSLDTNRYEKAELPSFVPGARPDQMYGVEKQRHYLNRYGQSASPVTVEKQGLAPLVEADGFVVQAPLYHFGYQLMYGSRQASRERHELQG